jgi:hypothetical protein
MGLLLGAAAIGSVLSIIAYVGASVITGPVGWVIGLIGLVLGAVGTLEALGVWFEYGC